MCEIVVCPSANHALHQSIGPRAEWYKETVSTANELSHVFLFSFLLSRESSLSSQASVQAVTCSERRRSLSLFIAAKMPPKRRFASRSSNLVPERPSKKLRLSSPPVSPASSKISPRNLKLKRSRVSPSLSVKSEQSQTEKIEDTIICAPIEVSMKVDHD